jgi:hypothetical protein
MNDSIVEKKGVIVNKLRALTNKANILHWENRNDSLRARQKLARLHSG